MNRARVPIQWEFTRKKPNHGSWLNQAECFFSILTKQGLQHSVERSKQDLKDLLAALSGQLQRHLRSLHLDQRTAATAAHYRNHSAVPGSPSTQAPAPSAEAETAGFYKELTGRCTSNQQ
jgi:hypothetical protein